jgi:hypothetical protein
MNIPRELGKLSKVEYVRVYVAKFNRTASEFKINLFSVYIDTDYCAILRVMSEIIKCTFFNMLR